MINTIRTCSNRTIRMAFRLDKWGRTVIKEGKVVRTEWNKKATC